MEHSHHDIHLLHAEKGLASSSSRVFSSKDIRVPPKSEEHKLFNFSMPGDSRKTPEILVN
jgi:hypothetical protein|tara:strand:- start:151 stop:330 length:180 start_codon:yes stop_codon:yes gene_type:complete